MHALRVEYPVPDYDAWKEAFDRDPGGRRQSGVRRYRLLRPTDDPNYIMLDLEFENLSAAEAYLAALRDLWPRLEAEGLIGSPQAQIIEAVEIKEY